MLDAVHSLRVAANLPALEFGAFGDGGSATWVLTLTEVSLDGTESEVPLMTEGVFARIERPLVSGATYRARLVSTTRSTCMIEQGLERTFVAGPASPLPAKLGTIVVEAQVYGERTAHHEGAEFCASTGAAAARSVRLVLDPEAVPWADVLRVGWSVEGTNWSLTSAPYDGSTPSATSEVEIYRACSDDLYGGPRRGRQHARGGGQVAGS